MDGIRVANAPCSWGTLGVEGLGGESIGDRQMLDELVETGDIGTIWATRAKNMLTAPAILRSEISRRYLSTASGYVAVALLNSEKHARGSGAKSRPVAGGGCRSKQ